MCEILFLFLKSNQNIEHLDILFQYIGEIDIQPSLVQCFDYFLSLEPDQMPKRRKGSFGEKFTGSLLDRLLSFGNELELQKSWFPNQTKKILIAFVSLNSIILITGESDVDISSLVSKLCSWIRIIISENFLQKVFVQKFFLFISISMGKLKILKFKKMIKIDKNIIEMLENTCSLLRDHLLSGKNLPI